MSYQFWEGKYLGNLLALDTETVADPDIHRKSPELVLGSVYNETEGWIINREDMAWFLDVHKDSEIIGHNIAFDYHVIENYLQYPINYPLLKIADENRLHDTMLLDQLVRLAQGKGQKGGIAPRNLQVLSEELCPEHAANKEMGGEDPYRMRYHELLQPSLFPIDPGFYEYALKDVEATWHSYQRLKEIGEKLVKPFLENGLITLDLIEKYGLLTEAIQVKASIALRKISLNGIWIDKPYTQSLEVEFRQAIEKEWTFLLNEYSHLFNFDKKGQIKITPKGKVPSMKTKELQNLLLSIADREGFEAPISKGKKKAISTSEKEWVQYKDKDPFILNWTNSVRSKNTLKFFEMFKTDTERVHPGYMTLKNTGRVSCKNPNLQQTPRNAKFRKLFSSPEGKKILTIDYAFIELRTLAAHCYQRLKYSVLGDTIKQGIDPHVYTASMVNNMTIEEFKQSNPKKFKSDRQAAKAINFGIPGGLGPKKLVDYAKTTYGVTFTLEQAKELKDLLIKKVYPELSKYLESTFISDLSYNLGLSEEFISNYLSSHVWGKLNQMGYSLGKIAKGEGEEYNQKKIVEGWKAIKELIKISAKPYLLKLISSGKGSKELYLALFGHPSVTLTGRIRAGCDYTDGKNNPFQSLAADGAKMSLWEIMKKGYKTIAFLHDEILCELDENDLSSVEDINQIMCQEMQKVMLNHVPVACEWHFEKNWVK